MITESNDGWANHSDEGPSFVLLYKNGYMVHQAAPGEPVIVKFDHDDAPKREFPSVAAAKEWVDNVNNG